MKDLVVVTGGAGFIGSNLVRKLNSEGINNIIIVDSLNKEGKWKNIANLRFFDFINYEIGIKTLSEKIGNSSISKIFHIGANSDVLYSDDNRMVQLNFEHSKFWLSISLKNNIPFVFASSSAIYGNELVQKKANAVSIYSPHNIYAFSKKIFENYVFRILKEKTELPKIIGLRFFNTYGFGEFHKGKNASLIYRFFLFLKKEGKIKLFENGDKIRRSYISVNDNVNIINEAMNRKIKSGIYDLGSGQPVSHKELAFTIIDVLKEEGFLNKDKPNESFIEYIPFPDNLRNRFQFFTKANIPEWIKEIPMDDFKTGVRKYLKVLLQKELEEKKQSREH